MSNPSFTFTTPGQSITIDQSELDALKARLGLTGKPGSAERLAEAMESTGMVTWGPAVELNPVGPSSDELEGL